MSFKVNYSGSTFTIDHPILGRALAALQQPDVEPLALKVNGFLRPLNWLIDDDANIEVLGHDSFEGHWVYRHTLSFLFVSAARRVLGKDVAVRHSISDALYWETVDGTPISDEEREAVQSEMRRLVEADLPIQRDWLSLDKVMKLFKQQGKPDTARLLELTGTDPVEVYRCGDQYGFFFGPLLDDMSPLKFFSLEKLGSGVALRMPKIDSPDELPPFEPLAEVFRVFGEYSQWLRALGVATMSDLHEKIAAGQAKDLVLLSEALHEAKLAQLAGEIVARPECRMLSVAGPSSAGKTTSAQKLKIQLRIAGAEPVNLSLDDYYLDDEHRPLDEQGMPDYETIDALDVERLQEDLTNLVAGKPTMVPWFDFKNRRRGGEKELQLSENGILIVEGLHGLNDKIVGLLKPEQRFGLFVSPITGVNLDSHNRTSTTDNRLLRRLVRDARTRGYGPEETLYQWPSVTRGANKYIFPFQKNADRFFNSVHLYELPVLKPFAEPLLRQVNPSSPVYGEACRLIEILRHVPSLPEELVPNNSVLREFIGGSIIEI